VALIKDLGFPVFVAAWLLIRDAKEKEQTREVLKSLEMAVSRLCERIAGGGQDGQGS